MIKSLMGDSNFVHCCEKYINHLLYALENEF